MKFRASIREEDDENLEVSDLLVPNIQTLNVQNELPLSTIENYEMLPLEENSAFDTNPQLASIPKPVPVKIGQGQYGCPICRKIMKYAHSMRNHILTHTGKRLFACEHCGKSYTRKDNLNNHLRTVHSQK